MHRKLVFIFNMFDDLVDPGIGKLLHFTTFLTNQMFVVTVVKSFLKLGDIIPELMFDHQLTFQQQIYRIVQCCTTNPVIFILHKYVQGFYIKVPGMRINLI